MTGIIDAGFEALAGDPQMVPVHVSGHLDLLGPLSLSPLAAPWTFAAGSTPESEAGVAAGGCTLLTGLTGTAEGAQLLVLINDASATQAVVLEPGYYTLSALFGVPATSDGVTTALISIAGVGLVSGGGMPPVPLTRHTSRPFYVAAPGTYSLVVSQSYGWIGPYGDAQIGAVDDLRLEPYTVTLGKVGSDDTLGSGVLCTGWGDGVPFAGGVGGVVGAETAAVRLRAPDATRWWEHDGYTFRVWGGADVTLQLPIPFGEGTPTSVVAIEPTSGLPAFYPFPTPEAPPPPLPSGGYGDLVWYNGTEWVVLVPTAVEGDTLELKDTGGAALQPQWGGGDQRSNIMAGALYLTDALIRAYTVTMQIIKSELQAAILAGVIAGTAISMEGLKTHLADLENPFIGAALGALEFTLGEAADLINAFLGALLGPLSPEVIHNLSYSLYLVLRPQLGGPTIHFGATESGGWRDAIYDHSTATVLQIPLLAALVLFYPYEKWDYWLSIGQTGHSANWKVQVYE